MAQTGFNVHLEWIRSAEKAVKEGNYEVAARLFRHVSTYYGIINDEPNRRKFAVKTGESYFNTGEVHLANEDFSKAIMFFIKATDSFREGEDEKLVERCKYKIDECYIAIKKDSSLKVHSNARDLKAIGDYFVRKNDLENGVQLFQLAADKAREEGKSILAAGIYRDIGDCHQALKGFEAAGKNYGTAADLFLMCDNHFEAARHYCESSFLFILAGKLQEASVMAAKAGFACDIGRIDVILNDLSEVCRLLSEKSLDEAEERWSKIRMKFKKSYVDVVDSCFESLSKP
jgi:tetratricopeptide (TPR) repeat protein